MKKFLFAIIAICIMAIPVFAQPANCTNAQTIAVPFAKDGAGTFCFVTPCMGSYINSWNMTKVEINGVDYTNRYADGVYSGGAWPAPINGKYYIYYNGPYPWSHFEISGSCSGQTAAPTAIPTAPPTTAPTTVPTTAPTSVPTVVPTIAPDVVTAWIIPTNQSVYTGSQATIEIHTNTTTAIGAFGFTVTYPTALLNTPSVSEIIRP
jgi:hypothetical protein